MHLDAGGYFDIAHLYSDAHYKNTVTRNYGEFDPIAETRNHINPCICGSGGNLINDTPALTQLRGAGANAFSVPRWFISCDHCRIKGPAARNSWQAILDWNRGHLSKKNSYKSLPLFGLKPLSIDQAHDRLISIRTDLELRIKEAKIKRNDQTVPDKDKPGGRYVAKMRAYLAWAIYAQALLKIERNAGSSHNRTYNIHP
jgi:hypothetical protein